jgi:hypothetical protein
MGSLRVAAARWIGKTVQISIMEDIGMHIPSRSRALSSPGSSLRLYVETGPDSQVAFWRINGYRAKLLIWTADEWEKLQQRPSDAQYHPKGVWCSLRVD